MPKPTEIPAPLSDRSSKHGRNVMAAAGVILVLAYVPGIEIRKFSLMGFGFDEGSESSVWVLLAIVLVYSAFRFGADCWTDYIGWRDTYAKLLKPIPHGQDVADLLFRRHARRLNKKFWVFDVTLPALMFLAAAVAAYQQIGSLWC